MKRCGKCKTEKTLKNFGKNRSMIGGLHSTCKSCRKIELQNIVKKNPNFYKEQYQKHRDKKIALTRKYYRDHREERLAYNKKYHEEYYKNNKDYVIEKTRAWYSANKDKKSAYDKIYRDRNRVKLRAQA